jgi:hypothetical protein
MGNSLTGSRTSQQRENEDIPKEKVYLNVYTLPADEIPKFLSIMPGFNKKITVFQSNFYQCIFLIIQVLESIILELKCMEQNMLLMVHLEERTPESFPHALKLFQVMLSL